MTRNTPKDLAHRHIYFIMIDKILFLSGDPPREMISCNQ